MTRRARTRTALLVLTPTLFLAAAGAAAAQAVQPPGAGAAGLDEEAPAAPGGASEAEVVMLRLRGGGIQWASIEEHGPQTLSVRRLGNGGLVHLPWSHLEPTQEHDLRLRFGYVDVEGEEPMTDGHRLILVDGNELVGRIQPTTNDPQVLTLKQESGLLLVPVSKVKDARPAQVAALEVFTKDELYAQRRGELELSGGEEDAQAQYELARFCERILAFPQALEHYRRARELDPDFKANELTATLARVEVKVALQEQLDVLAEADRWKRKGYYQKALDTLVAFDATYPDTQLRPDRLKLEDRIVKERTRELKRLVRDRWYSWMDRLAGEKARELPFEATIAWIDDSMSQEIVEKVTEDARRVWPEIEVDQVRQLWLERDPGRWKAASYGLATWLLGEDDALAGGPESTPKEAAPTERDRQREELEEKIDRFLKNQAMAKRASRSAEDEQEIQDFWSTQSSNTRKAWIIAYYAENAGDMELRPKPELTNCPGCGGTGHREVVYTGDARNNSPSAGLRLVPCPVCHTIGRVRRVRYR